MPPPIMPPPTVPADSRVIYRSLSLGAGVQSTVLALLLSRRDERLLDLGYHPPDAAIFADTGWEPAYVYRHLDWLEQQLTFPVIRVQASNIRDDLAAGRNADGRQFASIPFFAMNKDGSRAMMTRQCTSQYKLRPLIAAVREQVGLKPRQRMKPGQHVETYLGISYDELQRMKPNRERWIEHRWPLVHLRWHRYDCLQWFAQEYPDRSLRPSSCVICPYHDNKHWLALKDVEPESYADAVAFDRSLRAPGSPTGAQVDGVAYLHGTLRPLDEAVELAETAAKLQQPLPFIADFDAECEGMCGV